jgi:putative ABC transport system substrate-binding protein
MKYQALGQNSIGVRMDRRTILAGIGLLLAPSALGQGRRRARIGIIRPGQPLSASSIQVSGIADALRDIGHVDGTTITISNRFSDGGHQDLLSVATELIHDGADILVTIGLTATLAAREATRAVPIVAFANIDPVAAGLVGQLGRPNGNVTGVLVAPAGSLAAKRLSLLQEVVPNATKFALLAPDADPAFELQIQETIDAATSAAIDLTVVRDAKGNYDTAFDRMKAAGVDALVVGAHQFYVRDRMEIISLAERHKLPAIYEWQQHVQDGGLMSFGASLTERYGQLARHIDRILKGEKPSDIPFEQPAMLRMALNLRTARKLGLELPPSILVRVDDTVD